MKVNQPAYLRYLKYWLILAGVMLMTNQASAHQVGESYLHINIINNSARGQFDLALKDLDKVFSLDKNSDGTVGEEEIKAEIPAITAYLKDRVQFKINAKPLSFNLGGHRFLKQSVGRYFAVEFYFPDLQKAPQEIEIDYQLFFDIAPNHQGLMAVQKDHLTHTAIFNSGETRKRLLLDYSWGGIVFQEFLVHGINHILSGIDHVLFLITLLLQSVLYKRNRTWEPVNNFRPAIWSMIKTVTAFTIAHSITLSLAATEIFVLPARLVESIIAASIVFTGTDNLTAFFKGRIWLIAFCFGLFHGFGFAGVLTDLGLSQGALFVPLACFNIGVEIGQIIIIIVFFPILYFLSRKSFYIKRIFQPASLLITGVAAFWFIQRVFFSS